MRKLHDILFLVMLLTSACTLHDTERMDEHAERVDSAYAYLKAHRELPQNIDLEAEAEWLASHSAHTYAGKTFYILGAHANLQGKDSLAMKHLKMAEVEWLQAEDAPAALVGMTYYKEGRISENEMLTEVALYHYRQALPFLEQAGDSLYLSSVCREIARTTTDTAEQRLFWERALRYAEALSKPLQWDTRYQMLSHTQPCSRERIALSKQLCDSAHQFRFAADVVRQALRESKMDEAEHYLSLLKQDTIEYAWSQRQYRLLNAKMLYQQGRSREAYNMLEEVYEERIGQMEQEGAARSYTIAERFDNTQAREENLQLTLTRQRLQSGLAIGICLVLLTAALLTIIGLHRRGQHQEQQERMRQLLLQRIANADKSHGLFESEKDWQEFRTQFDSAYSGKLGKLQKQHPALTTADMQVIALTEMGLDTSDICRLLGVNKQSIWNRKQRIKQHMKHLPLIFSVLLSTALVSCEEYPGEPLLPSYQELTQQDHNRILNDTVAPPNNPLMPGGEYTPSIYTIAGALECQYIQSLDGTYPCVVVNGEDERERNYYVLHRWGKVIRFNHPDLEGLHMGDTLLITGEVSYRMAGDIHFAVADNHYWYSYHAPAYVFEYIQIAAKN